MLGRGKRQRAALAASAALILSLLASPAVAEESAPAPTPGLPTEGTTDQLIVTSISAAVSDATVEQATAQAGADVGLEVTADVTRVVAPTTTVVRLDQALPLDEAERLADELAQTREVLRAEPDIVIRPTSATLPNDPYTSQLWGLWQGAASGNGGFGTRAPAAWPTSRGSGVVVAVLDTGSTPHPDLDANTIAGYDFITSLAVANDGDGRDSNPADPGDWEPGFDSSWHGTHVAGTIAAVTDNNLGVAGVAPSAQVQHVRVLGTGGGYMSDVADGIKWAAGAAVTGVPNNTTPARVLNLSLGGYGDCEPYIQSAVDTAIALGSVVVVSAGNDNANASGLTPANCNGVITVASHTTSGAKSWFSNFGSAVEISGPGSGIVSTVNSGTTVPVAPAYASYSGTSMAAPHVAGTAALALSADPNLTPAQVTTLLQYTAQPFASGSTCTTSLCGAGYVDATAALQALTLSAPSSLSVTPDYDSLDISWAAPFSVYPLHYDIEYSTDGTAWTPDDTVTATSTTINGLNPADAFLVRVRAATADDSSAWTTTDTAVNPLARTVPGPVGPVTGTIDDTTLLMSWSAPAVDGGYAIDHYTVEYSTDDSTWVADDTTTATTAVIDGLSNGTAYRVRISAVNQAGAGTGVLSDLLTPRVLTAPSAPTNLMLTPQIGGIALAWSAPADDGGRAVDGYVIEYSSDGTTWSALPGTVTGYSSTITGLNGGTTYTVRIAADNVIGTGPWASETATPTSPAPPPAPPPAPAPPPPPPPPPAPVITLPGAPTITEVGSNDGTVFALWQASDDTGGESPSDFVIELAGPEGIATSTSGIAFVEISGLTNGAGYRIRVAATNSAGTGEFSAWSDTVTPIGLAGAPTELDGSPVDGGVELTWAAPDDTGGAPIEDYVVQWVSDGVEVALTTESTSIRLQTLANGTRYEFRVAAQTEAGVGEWSAPLALVPRADPVTAPERVSLDRKGRKITVTWSAPAVGEPQRYVVASSINGSSFRIKRSTASTQVRLSISKRTKTIAVRVLAIDSYGRGPWSDSTTERIKRKR